MEIGNTINPLAPSDNSEGDSTAELLTGSRLNQIKRNTRTTASTWTNLCDQYPPGNTDFAPLFITDKERAKLSPAQSTELASNLAVDEAYSQAATMVVYGVNILHEALSGPNVATNSLWQARDIFASLCSTLSDTRDAHESKIVKMIAESGSAHRHEQGVEAAMEPEKAIPPERTWSNGRLRPRLQTKQGGTSVQRGRSHPYLRNGLHAEIPWWQRISQANSGDSIQINCDSAQESDIIAGAQLLGQLPNANDGQFAGKSKESGSVSASLATVSGPDSVLGDSLDAGDGSFDDSDSELEDGVDDILSSLDSKSTEAASTIGLTAGKAVLPPELCRRNVVHYGLERQGLSESAIDAYFKQYSAGTNRDYEGMWELWAMWCVAKGIDPSQRSDEELDSYVLGRKMSGDSRKRLQGQVRLVWSIVEGFPPPEKKNRARRKRKYF
ncbi:hypothetical protein IWW57_001483 [Coemansia sp. S610]|nr:hypothetical protein IWW57_001483 [Coemansia sp. S610]